MLARQRLRVLLFAFVMFLASIALAVDVSGRPARFGAECHARGGYVKDDDNCIGRPIRFMPPASHARCLALNNNGYRGPLHKRLLCGEAT